MGAEVSGIPGGGGVGNSSGQISYMPHGGRGGFLWLCGKIRWSRSAKKSRGASIPEADAEDADVGGLGNPFQGGFEDEHDGVDRSCGARAKLELALGGV